MTVPLLRTSIFKPMGQFFPILAEHPFLSEMILILEDKRDFVHVWVCWLGEICDIDEVKGQRLGVAPWQIGSHTRLVTELTVMSQYQACFVGMVHRRHHRFLSLRHRLDQGRATAGPLTGERAGVRGKPTTLPLSAFPLLPAREEGPKGRMALSHSLFQASGFAGGRSFGGGW